MAGIPVEIRTELFPNTKGEVQQPHRQDIKSVGFEVMHQAHLHGGCSVAGNELSGCTKLTILPS
jgi:hypothetical protein